MTKTHEPHPAPWKIQTDLDGLFTVRDARCGYNIVDSVNIVWRLRGAGVKDFIQLRSLFISVGESVGFLLLGLQTMAIL